jgi:hypothetical protein
VAELLAGMGRAAYHIQGGITDRIVFGIAAVANSQEEEDEDGECDNIARGSREEGHIRVCQYMPYQYRLVCS